MFFLFVLGNPEFSAQSAQLIQVHRADNIYHRQLLRFGHQDRDARNVIVGVFHYVNLVVLLGAQLFQVIQLQPRILRACGKRHAEQRQSHKKPDQSIPSLNDSHSLISSVHLRGLRRLHSFDNVVQLRVRNAQRHQRLLLRGFSFPPPLNVSVVQKAQRAAHDQHRGNSARQRGPQPTPVPEFAEPACGSWGSRDSRLSLNDMRHHSLGKWFARILPPQCSAKIVFRKLHNVPLSICASTFPAVPQACGEVCSSLCSPACSGVLRFRPDPTLPGSAKAPPSAVSPEVAPPLGAIFRAKTRLPGPLLSQSPAFPPGAIRVGNSSAGYGRCSDAPPSAAASASGATWTEWPEVLGRVARKPLEPSLRPVPGPQRSASQC